MLVSICLLGVCMSLAAVCVNAWTLGSRRSRIAPPRLFKGLGDILSLADWRNVNIGLRADERTGVLFTRRRPLESSEDDTASERHDSAQQLETQEMALQADLHYIEAIEQRNEAQLMSFIDEKHQWESQSQEDRDMLLSKNEVVAKLDEVRRRLKEMSQSA